MATHELELELTATYLLCRWQRRSRTHPGFFGSLSPARWKRPFPPSIQDALFVSFFLASAQFPPSFRSSVPPSVLSSLGTFANKESTFFFWMRSVNYNAAHQDQYIHINVLKRCASISVVGLPRYFCQQKCSWLIIRSEIGRCGVSGLTDIFCIDLLWQQLWKEKTISSEFLLFSNDGFCSDLIGLVLSRI